MSDIFTVEIAPIQDTYTVVLSYAGYVQELQISAPEGTSEVEILQGYIGPPGPQGAEGPKGDFGSPETFYFNSAATQWVVNHNLGRRPAVEVYTSGGLLVMAEVLHVSTNIANINFDAPMSGFVIVT